MFVSLLARPRGSLRQWLLGASVIAVLAGYGVLLMAYGWLADLDRREAHRQMASQLLALVQQQGALPAELSLSGVDAWIVEGSGAIRPLVRALDRSPVLLPPPALVRRQQRGVPLAGPWNYGEQSYLSSATPLGSKPPGGRVLYVLQDVTLDIRRQQRNSLLLLIFAGVSTLVSSALLRPVLDAGLRPLEDLSDRMEQIETETLGRKRLPLAPQPRELQRIAATFNDLLDRLAVSWERQRAFVNAVSHELRTPITLVAGYAARLQRRGINLSAAEREQLHLIEEEAARMGRMVTDLLDIARSDAGQLTLRRQRFDVASACLQVVDRLRPVAAGRLRLAPEAAEREQATHAVGDPERFEQCLLNLVENALKYSPPTGLVQLAWECCGDAVLVHVLDQGPGVPEEDRARLLERFQRGQGTGDVPGSGIGLAVVDTLMQAMGGRVDIGDAPGGGADFRLLLPMAPEPELKEPARSAPRAVPGAPS
ncbi:MAG: HAMP domain-containing sensor histidine kinase [Cyanobacteria bacterium]|nr:HAMP domain-containing sensor histidine kinase [Cyanobacteriota bacterium]